GRGFDAAGMMRKRWQDRGLGLAGMQERATLLDGSVEIESEPGAGTLITVTIPLRERGRSLAAANGLPRAYGGESAHIATPARPAAVAPGTEGTDAVAAHDAVNSHDVHNSHEELG
ncbi:MAG TPA: ATP-binding protein, partial [Ktedonobacterales bacterium]|nr:ATP-binding protein [Ktedonobacterales bacterium]